MQEENMSDQDIEDGESARAEAARISGSATLQDIFKTIEDNKHEMWGVPSGTPKAEEEDKESTKTSSVFQVLQETEFEPEEVAEEEQEPEENSEEESLIKEEYHKENRSKTWQVNKDNHRLTGELEKTKQELNKAYAALDQLSYSEKQLWDNNLAFYESKAKDDLDKAEAMLEAAEDAYDTKAKVRAQKLLVDANVRMREIDNYYRDQQARSAPLQAPAPNYYPDPYYQRAPQYAPQQYAPVPVQDPVHVAESIINSWVDSHDVINPGSPKYNEAVWDQVRSYAANYEKGLKEKGRESEILSDNYLNHMDGYLNAITSRPTVSKAPMLSTSHIASAKSSSGGGVAAPRAKTIHLTAPEEMAIENSAAAVGIPSGSVQYSAFRDTWIQGIKQQRQLQNRR